MEGDGCVGYCTSRLKRLLLFCLEFWEYVRFMFDVSVTNCVNIDTQPGIWSVVDMGMNECANDSDSDNEWDRKLFLTNISLVNMKKELCRSVQIICWNHTSSFVEP